MIITQNILRKSLLSKSKGRNIHNNTNRPAKPVSRSFLETGFADYIDMYENGSFVLEFAESPEKDAHEESTSQHGRKADPPLSVSIKTIKVIPL